MTKQKGNKNDLVSASYTVKRTEGNCRYSFCRYCIIRLSISGV